MDIRKLGRRILPRIPSSFSSTEEKQNTVCIYIYIYTHYIVNSYLKALFVNRTQVKWTVKGKTVQCFGQINIGYQVKTLEKMSTDSVLYAARLL